MRIVNINQKDIRIEERALRYGKGEGRALGTQTDVYSISVNYRKIELGSNTSSSYRLSIV